MRPRLLQLPNNGPLLLSGGRLCTENVTDAFVWSLDRADATHQKWKKHSLSYEHNSLWEGDRNLRFSGRYVNDSDATGKVRDPYSARTCLLPEPRRLDQPLTASLAQTMTTLGYTALLPAPGRSAVVAYPMRPVLGGHLAAIKAQVGFSMPIAPEG